MKIEDLFVVVASETIGELTDVFVGRTAADGYCAVQNGGNVGGHAHWRVLPLLEVVREMQSEAAHDAILDVRELD